VAQYLTKIEKCTIGKGLDDLVRILFSPQKGKRSKKAAFSIFSKTHKKCGKTCKS